MDSRDPNLDRINGWIPTHLDERGIKEAHADGSKLRHAGITGILASDLTRTRDTANIFGEILHMSPAFDMGLRSRNMGILAGQLAVAAKPTLEVFNRHPDIAIPGGESYEDYIRRWRKTFEKIQEFAQKFPEKCLLGVTHSMNIADATAIAEGKEPSGDLPSGIPPAGLMRFWFGDGAWRMEKV
jgi:probable phosphoglycerate mutase